MENASRVQFGEEINDGHGLFAVRERVRRWSDVGGKRAGALACPSLEGFLSYLRKRWNRGVAYLASDGDDVVDNWVPVMFFRKVTGKRNWVVDLETPITQISFLGSSIRCELTKDRAESSQP